MSASISEQETGHWKILGQSKRTSDATQVQNIYEREIWMEHKDRKEVDWEMLKTCTRITQESEETVCKLVNNQLPTCHRKEVRGAYAGGRCRYCGQEETFAHLLKCNNKHANKF